MERRRRAARSSLVIALVATGLRFAGADAGAAAGETVSQPGTNFGRVERLRVSGKPRSESSTRRRPSSQAPAARRPRPAAPGPTGPATPPAPPPSTPPSSPRPTPGAAPDCKPAWAPAEPIGQLGDGLGEMSAFIATPDHHGWGWGIRDSGKPASLYAIQPRPGGLARTQEFRAYDLTNSDWEDMAHTPGPEPGTGHLWVLENVGNGWTGERWIHQFEEPDPESPPPLPPAVSAVSAVPPATLVGSYRWAYPDGQANTETMFVFDGDLVVVSKTDPSRVYRFHEPLQPSVVNVPTYVGTLPAGHFLSVAAISADQRTLAVSNHGKVDVYVNRGDVNDLRALIANPVAHHEMPPDNREGGSFFPYGSCDLLLVAESKTIWRLEHG